MSFCNKKRIAILSAGTGAGLAYCNAIRAVTNKEMEILACDINPRYLTIASTIADYYEQVPAILDSGYYEYMLDLFCKYRIDYLIPVIDYDLQLFSVDNVDLTKMNIIALSPFKSVFQALSDKEKLGQHLLRLEVQAPKLYCKEDVSMTESYFVKPKIGFGSRNVRIMKGSEIKGIELNDFVVQELCEPEEISLDVFCGNDMQIKFICRNRIEVKAGVCTKAKVFYEPYFEDILNKIGKAFKLPYVSCVQFMKSRNNDWLLTDFNLRLGAGSALSAAVGFKLSEAAIINLLGMDRAVSLDMPTVPQYVLRTYKEIVI